MCGISGAIGHVDDTVRAGVQAMHAALVHRGPDGDGVWEAHAADGMAADGIAADTILAHRRLAIIDLREEARQPMIDPATGCVIVYNGEVYNYLELRRELESLGHAFRSESDTEVVLAAVIEWGTKALDRFRGMFAFALYDPRNRTVTLARDRVGIKPLYVTRVTDDQGRETILFASEVRGLLATGLVARRMDPASLAAYVWNGFVTGPGTIIRDVRIIDPGTVETIQLDDLSVESRAYYRPPDFAPQADARDRLAHALEESVRLRLVSDVPLGIFLSGGIDSSAVAALAAGPERRELKTFNIAFDESDFDESEYARAVADSIGSDHHEIRMTQATFHEQLDDALRCVDQPTFDALNTYLVSRAVREAGLTVALAGTGGDEIFGGYTSFVDLPKAQTWSRRSSWVPGGVLGLLTRVAIRAKMGRAGRIPQQMRWGKLPDVLATKGKLLDLYQVSYSLFRRDFQDRLIAGDGVNGVNHGLRTGRYQQLSELVDRNPTQHAISLMELSCFIGDRLLRDTDCASMAVSLEVRVPILDHEIIAAAAGIEDLERFSPPLSKKLLRDLALSGLDSKIFDRPKSGFVLPIEDWCRGALEDVVGDLFRDTALAESIGLDPTAVLDLWQAFQERAPGIYWSRIWSIFVILWWSREHQVTL